MSRIVETIIGECPPIEIRDGGEHGDTDDDFEGAAAALKNEISMLKQLHGENIF